MTVEDDGPPVVALVLATSLEAVDAVRPRFSRAGFRVGPASGPTFSIEAAAGTFEETFGTAVQAARDGGWTTEQGDEFPLSGLPHDWGCDLVAVAFERPAELHEDGG